ncbi:MAG: VOC family protein [Oligoflexales bacterium]
MLLAVDHVQITIPKGADEKALEFYGSFLGLKQIEKPENRRKNGGFWLALGDTQIHVGTEDGVDRTKTKAHVAYRVDNLQLWREKLEKINLECYDSPPFPNARAFEFRDPFGNRVELIELTNGLLTKVHGIR